MTEKRFTKYVPDSYGYTYITTIIDNEKNKQTGNTDEIVDMLNELAEENKELQTKNNAYLQDIEVYREENTHLKLENDKLKSKNRGLQSELQIFKEDVTHSNLQINKLSDENEQLKKDCSNLIDDNTEYVAEINQMHKENGELKKILGFLRNDNATDILNVLNSQENQIWKLKKENEQLKSEIKDLNDILARYEEKELQE